MTQAPVTMATTGMTPSEDSPIMTSVDLHFSRTSNKVIFIYDLCTPLFFLKI